MGYNTLPLHPHSPQISLLFRTLRYSFFSLGEANWTCSEGSFPPLHSRNCVMFVSWNHLSKTVRGWKGLRAGRTVWHTWQLDSPGSSPAWDSAVAWPGALKQVSMWLLQAPGSIFAQLRKKCPFGGEASLPAQGSASVAQLEPSSSVMQPRPQAGHSLHGHSRSSESLFWFITCDRQYVSHQTAYSDKAKEVCQAVFESAC